MVAVEHDDNDGVAATVSIVRRRDLFPPTWKLRHILDDNDDEDEDDVDDADDSDDRDCEVDNDVDHMVAAVTSKTILSGA